MGGSLSVCRVSVECLVYVSVSVVSVSALSLLSVPSSLVCISRSSVLYISLRSVKLEARLHIK